MVAVALGAQGRYAAAATELAALAADPGVPSAVAAHAAVTRASHLRQLGGHGAARRFDARGLRLAVQAPIGSRDADGTDAQGAQVDALVGLAADALGVGDQVVACRLLDRAERSVPGHPSWRVPVRAGWVRAELALLMGQASAAVGPASAALDRARAAGACRHTLKSRLVLAVATAAAGTWDAVAVLAELDAVASACAAHGLLPLQWAACVAAGDVASRDDKRRRTAAGDGSAAHAGILRRHAAARVLGVLYRRTDPVGRSRMGVADAPRSDGGVISSFGPNSPT